VSIPESSQVNDLSSRYRSAGFARCQLVKPACPTRHSRCEQLAHSCYAVTGFSGFQTRLSNTSRMHYILGFQATNSCICCFISAWKGLKCMANYCKQNLLHLYVSDCIYACTKCCDNFSNDFFLSCECEYPSVCVVVNNSFFVWIHFYNKISSIIHDAIRSSYITNYSLC